MWVKMRTRMTGASGFNAEPDQVVDLPDAMAQDLIAGRYAAAVDPPKVAKAPVAEAAVLTPEENAAMDPPVPRFKRNASRDR